MRQINNTSWTPFPMTLALSLICFTLIVECGFLALYARKRGYKAIFELIGIVFILNLITGMIGLTIGVFFQ